MFGEDSVHVCIMRVDKEYENYHMHVSGGES